MTEPASTERQRLDKWLWFARVVRTRTAAQALATSGHVRINGVRVHSASQPVRVFDVLTIALEHGVRVLEVRAFAERRGSAPDAQHLFRDVGRETPRDGI